MKNTMNNKLAGGLTALLLMTAAGITTSTMQAQDWSSTSSMQGSGSAYSSQVTPVGANTVDQTYTTPDPSGSSANHISGRRNFDTYNDPNKSKQSPIGSEWVLLAFAAGAAGGITLRRRK